MLLRTTPFETRNLGSRMVFRRNFSHENQTLTAL